MPFEYEQVGKYQDPRDACVAVVEEAYRIWLKYETRTDDITVIVVHIDGLRDVRRIFFSCWSPWIIILFKTNFEFGSKVSAGWCVIFFLQNKSQKSPSVDIRPHRLFHPILLSQKMKWSHQRSRGQFALHQVFGVLVRLLMTLKHHVYTLSLSQRLLAKRYFTVPSCEPSGALCQYHRAHMFPYLQF